MSVISKKYSKVENIFLVLLIFSVINFRRYDELFGLSGGTESIIYFLLNIIILGYLLFTRAFKTGIKKHIIFFALWITWSIIISSFINNFKLSIDFWGEIRNAFLALITLLNLSYLIKAHNFKFALRLFIFSVLSLSIIVISNTGIISLTDDGRLENDLGLNTNHLAYFISLAVSLFVFTKKIFKKEITFVLIVFFVLITLILASRKAFIGQIIFFLSFYLFSVLVTRKFNKVIILVVISALVFFTTEFVVKNSFLGERLMRTLSLEDFNTIEYQRAEHYQNFIPLLIEHPFVGVGLGNIINYSSYHKQSHSEYISIINETGIIGGFLYFGIYFIFINNLNRVYKKKKQLNWKLIPIGYASLIMLLLFSFGRWNYSSPVHFAYLALLFSLVEYYDKNTSSSFSNTRFLSHKTASN